ncbi:hypothetical protein GNI_101750 [Gregarina niphandrodes]|uniref:Uncharacterized protein n=1 Tax=Gregarina niphandrodes TaxID=110365 RepID=A0A023B4S0_GRENI|nr:hypothetical protein GNI_101750 [Gregarina niphandrodes]EZG56716.1 hypothetical protein GNI_101750 [Gregarina niphandrodes]|eukprot:XP_011131184.1 hypothetical protein GNI_101750 [Gregarina niphandrodes]
MFVPAWTDDEWCLYCEMIGWKQPLQGPDVRDCMERNVACWTGRNPRDLAEAISAENMDEWMAQRKLAVIKAGIQGDGSGAEQAVEMPSSSMDSKVVEMVADEEDIFCPFVGFRTPLVRMSVAAAIHEHYRNELVQKLNMPGISSIGFSFELVCQMFISHGYEFRHEEFSADSKGIKTGPAIGDKWWTSDHYLGSVTWRTFESTMIKLKKETKSWTQKPICLVPAESNFPCVDILLLKKKTAHLIQITVGKRHSLALEKLQDMCGVMKATGITKIRFCFMLPETRLHEWKGISGGKAMPDEVSVTLIAVHHQWPAAARRTRGRVKTLNGERELRHAEKTATEITVEPTLSEVLQGLQHLKQEVKDGLTEVKEELKGVKEELKGVKEELKGVKEELKDLRTDVKDGLTAVRDEIRTSNEKLMTFLGTLLNKPAITGS